jgi:hypothetical protein
MATSRSIEQIRWNVSNGVSSYDDLKVVLSRYEQLMEDVKEIDKLVWKEYKRQEKDAE